LKTLNHFDNFLWAEDENTKLTLHQFGKDFELYKRSFNLLCETKAHLHELMEEDPRKISTAKKAILMIVNRIIQLMQSIRVLNLKGYYYDVRVLSRCLLESAGLCAYFALNEEEVDNWVKGNLKIAKIRLIDYISLLFEVKERRGIPFYGKLSEYVHTNVGAIASLVVAVHPEMAAIDFQLTPIFDKEKAIEISAYPTFMLIILAKIFRDELTDKRRGEIMRFVEKYAAEKREK